MFDDIFEDKGKKKEEKVTPEEKLFRVIAAGGRDNVDLKETSKSGGGSRKILEQFKKLASKISLPPKNPLSSFVQNLRERASGLGILKTSAWTKTSLPPVSLKTLNKGFVILAAVLILYLLGDMVFGHRPVFQPGFSDFGRSQAIQIFPSFPQENMRPVSYYLTPITNRNVFMPPGTTPAGISAEEQQLKAQQAPEGYKLVGISWDEQGFVAMVEVPGEESARFVRKGDELPNGVKVKEIENYSVVLTSDMQKWELS